MAKINAKNTAQNKLKQGTILDFLGVAKGSGVQKPKVAKARNTTKEAIRRTGSQSVDEAVSPKIGSGDTQSSVIDPMLLDDDEIQPLVTSQSGIEFYSQNDSSQSSQLSSLFSATGEPIIGSQDTDITLPYIEEEVVDEPAPARATWASLLNGVSTTPTLLDGGFETVGEGSHLAIFRVKILPQHSSRFFEGPISHVDKSDEAVKQLRQQAQNYPTIRENTIVRCSDGKPLLYFMKGGMLSGLTPDERRDLPEQSINAVRALTEVYRPPPPKKTDSRMQAEQRRIQSEKNGVFGRYMLCYWHDQGAAYKPPHISNDSKPTSAEAMAKLTQFMEATKWEHVQVAKWILTIDPQIHKELHACYQALSQEKLQHLYQGPEACHSGLALLINRVEDPHKDSNDARDNFTSTNSWSSYEGGCVCYRELGVKIAQEPGDLTLCRAAVLTHFVEEITSGERFCLVRFTKKDILRPTGEVREALDLHCPFEGCSRICRSEESLRKHLRGPTDKASRERRSSTYHWLENPEVKIYMAEAKKNRLAVNGAEANVDGPGE